jgi:hypothetical protein
MIGTPDNAFMFVSPSWTNQDGVWSNRREKSLASGIFVLRTRSALASLRMRLIAPPRRMARS